MYIFFLKYTNIKNVKYLTSKPNKTTVYALYSTMKLRIYPSYMEKLVLDATYFACEISNSLTV